MPFQIYSSGQSNTRWVLIVQNFFCIINEDIDDRVPLTQFVHILQTLSLQRLRWLNYVLGWFSLHTNDIVKLSASQGNVFLSLLMTPDIDIFLHKDLMCAFQLSSLCYIMIIFFTLCTSMISTPL